LTGAPPSGLCQYPYYQWNLTASQAEQVLSAHNYYRNITASGNSPHQPAASNMLQMEWNDGLAQTAQAWADHCNFSHPSNAERNTTQFAQVGQNLAQAGSSQYESAVNWESLVAQWYDEVFLYNTSAPVSSFQMESSTGHYTQLVWANSWAVGCGFLQYFDGKYYWDYLVCNYGPAGNVINKAMYTVGAPTCKASASWDYLCTYPLTPAADVAELLQLHTRSKTHAHAHAQQH